MIVVEITEEMKLENLKIHFLTFHLSLFIIYIYIKFSYTIIFENLMNNATSLLLSLLCKSSVNKYMIMVRSVTNEIIKKIYKIN